MSAITDSSGSEIFKREQREDGGGGGGVVVSPFKAP